MHRPRQRAAVFCRGIVIATAILAAATSAACAVTDGIGVGRGARMFITKVYPDLTPKEFRQLADAGFTVVVKDTDVMDPTRNDGSLAYMPEYFRMASEVGLDAATWQGGMPNAREGEAPRITREGKTSSYATPVSAKAWEAYGDAIMEWVTLSLKHTNYKFLAVDYEIYDGSGGNGLCESYDDMAFTGFLQSIDKPIPSPLPALNERYDYLKQQGLIDAYTAYQRDIILREMRKIRQRIDQVNPRFQIGVYGWGSLFSAVMEAMATSKAPVLHLNHSAYGRGKWDPAYDHLPEGGYLPTRDRPDRDGLRWSLNVVSGACKEAALRSYPVILLGGHWVQATGPEDGSQYKFTVRQSFNSAAYADGYWIWTDQFVPKPWESVTEWIDAMMAYWKEANAALDAGDYMWSSRQPDTCPNPNATKPLLIQTTNGKMVTTWDPITGKRVGKPKRFTGAPTAVPNVKLGDNVIRINGLVAEVVDAGAGKVVSRFGAGHGLRAVVVGDIDSLHGDEVMTLNAGWIRIWDPETSTELLRFRVGNDQMGLMLSPSRP